MSNTRPRTYIEELSEKNAAAQAASEHLAMECSEKAYKIRLLNEQLTQAKRDLAEYRKIAEDTTHDTIFEALRGMHAIQNAIEQDQQFITQIVAMIDGAFEPGIRSEASLTCALASIRTLAKDALERISKFQDTEEPTDTATLQEQTT